jgi:hypothetical protein
MDFRLQFAEQVRLALYGTGGKKLRCGGVDFWFDRFGNLVYSLPTSQWDMGLVSYDLQVACKLGLKRAQAAVSQEGA